MDPEAAGMGAPRGEGLRGGLHQGRPRRGGRGRDLRQQQGRASRQGRHPENEPAQVRQGGGHGRPHLPQRGLRPAQRQGEILLRPHLRKLDFVFTVLCFYRSFSPLVLLGFSNRSADSLITRKGQRPKQSTVGFVFAPFIIHTLIGDLSPNLHLVKLFSIHPFSP